MQNKKINDFSFNLWVCLFILLQLNLSAQTFDLYDIPVYKNGKLLSLPYTGGIRAGQFSNIDLNGDGVMDLFVFDRNGDQVIPLVHTGNPGEAKFRYAPEYISWFPPMQNWAVIVDFNRDGVPDIFTSSLDFPGSIAVWRGRRINGRLSFSLVTFDYGLRRVLQFPIAGGFTQIYVSSIDFPGILDVDGDGDIDILSFEPEGSLMQYYQNQAVEENLPADSLKYIRKDVCWGKFRENEFSQEITLSNDPFSCAVNFTGDDGQGIRHSGSAVLAFDADGDGDMDLLLGDLANHHMTFLHNGGNRQNAWMTGQDIRFPSYDVPIDIEIFLGAYYVDVDGDGKRDLIATPNEAFSAENADHIWFYRNKGTDSSPVFELVTKSFLVDEMLYFYNASHPAFFDYNADGLTDILIGTNGIINKGGSRTHRMALLKNIGTPSSPAFEVVTEDYLGFSVFDEFTGRFAPAFGDLDGDGDTDLMIGDVRGFLYYLENTAGPGNPVNFKSPVYRYSNIFVGQNAKPQLADLDGDGLPDIIVGEKNNQFNFIKNVGTKTNPSFGASPGAFPNTESLGNLYPGGNDFNTQNGAPFFYKENNKWNMLLGIDIGDIRRYDQIEGNIYGSFRLADEKVGNLRPGRRTTVAVEDLDGDGYFELAVGNERGGLTFYKTPFRKESMVNTDEVNNNGNIQMYPNPASDFIWLEVSNIDVKCKVMNLSGQYIMELSPGSNDIRELSPGMYYIQVKALDSTRLIKFIKL
jgi:hypothetical protein